MYTFCTQIIHELYTSCTFFLKCTKLFFPYGPGWVNRHNQSLFLTWDPDGLCEVPGQCSTFLLAWWVRRAPIRWCWNNRELNPKYTRLPRAVSSTISSHWYLIFDTFALPKVIINRDSYWKQQTRLALAIQCLGGGGGVPAAHTVRQGHHRTPLCGRYRLNALSITFQIRFPRWGRALGAPGAAISPLGPMSKKEIDSLILCLLKKYRSIFTFPVGGVDIHYFCP